MKKLQFKTKINAPVQKVYKIMLGIDDKNTYQQWTSVFNPTSTFEGSWEKGSKMYFIGIDENGKKGGMISEVTDHQPSKFVSIRHYGLLDGNIEITTGEEVEKWAGGFENYTYEEHQGTTTVTVDIEVTDDHLDYFNNTYPMALEKLKTLAEN